MGERLSRLYGNELCHVMYVCTRRAGAKTTLNDIQLYGIDSNCIYNNTPSFPTIFLESSTGLPLAVDHTSISIRLITLPASTISHPPLPSAQLIRPQHQPSLNPPRKKKKAHGSLPPPPHPFHKVSPHSKKPNQTKQTKPPCLTATRDPAEIIRATATKT